MLLAKKNCAVIGAGIIGLHAAVALALRGFKPTIFTADSPFNTATIAAGAIWMPYKALPADKVLAWASRSLEYYTRLAHKPEAGVIWRDHTEFFLQNIGKPAWMELLQEGAPPSCQLPAHFACYYSVRLPVIDTYKLVTYYLSLLQAANVDIIYQKINSLDDLKEYKSIINAAGIGAKDLTHDPDLYAIKGQTFTLTQPVKPITQSVFFDEGSQVTLVIPHPNHVTIGVTVKERDTSLDYDEAEHKKLFESACAFYPQLSESKVIARRVGIRPARTSGIRIEKEYYEKNKQSVVYACGAAGGGITLGPAIADEAVQLLTRDL